MDSLLNDNRAKLALTMERQQDSHVQIVELNLRVAKLTDVIDRMASRLESLTTTFASNDISGQDNSTRTIGIIPICTDSRRRRSLDEMKEQASDMNQEQSAHRQFTEISPRQQNAHVTDTTDSIGSSHQRTINTSPTKKKSRSLQDDMEDTSLGSNISEEIEMGNDDYSHNQLREPSLPDSSLLDDSDEFSTPSNFKVFQREAYQNDSVL